MKQLLIGSSIQQILMETAKSDAEIAIELGVARDTIYRWRTGSTKVIRRKNLMKLAAVFKQSLKYNDDGRVDFIPQNPVKNDAIPLENKLGENEMKSIIQTLQKQIDYLMNENKRLRNNLESPIEKKF
ncbi:MAG: helix-turn-helix transcriptional regulator [Candidatus Marinimicrobia bacterium]|nr:helix-turn-helix transcriptional regulator [Candidatus Neomarinimicrobiota bacterium]